MEQSDRPRVLLADDNEDLCGTLALILRLEGYVVDCVGDGAAAVAAARDSRYDVCILDILMPRVSGGDVARDLRGKYGSDCPFLIGMSGEQVASVYRKEAVPLFDAFLQKPADPAEIVALVKSALRNSRERP